MRNTYFWRREVHHCLHYGNIGTLSPRYGSAEMKSQWGILVFEEEKFTTVSIRGTLVHSHPVTDQLKWSHNEEYLFLKKRSSPLSPLRELWYTLTPLRISWNEVTMRNTCFWRREVLPLSPLGELWYTLTPLRISWNEVTMRNTWFWRRYAHHCFHYRSFSTLSPCFGISWNEVTMKTTCIWRRDIHLRSFGTLSPHYGSAEMKLQWTLIFFE
jgi:hypothetical protein